MYSYIWDPETGGLLLNTTPLAFSKEPRPVYYQELDLLGFDRYWNYDKNDSYPYMWAENVNYYYRGRIVAKLRGGSAYNSPDIIIVEDPEPNKGKLRFVDIPAMVEKNNEIIETLTQETIKEAYNTYFEYANKVNVFYVAFSGGKDSAVMLDIIQRALPHNSFKVLFGDTGMEFPDTYKYVEKTEKLCKENGIEFYIAKAETSPLDNWLVFGPPATVTRWCCSVHKTAPQILKLREITGMANFTGMAFVGVRASESLSRSEYEYVSRGEKHKGQYSCNPILEWNSAELFLYMYSRGIEVGESYKKGNHRAGCLVCPRASERNEYICRMCYPNKFEELMNLIRMSYRGNFTSEDKLEEFIRNGGWKARKNGRDISIPFNYNEYSNKDVTTIHIDEPKSDWREWIKTIGVLVNNSSPYTIDYKKELFEFNLVESSNSIEVTFSNDLSRNHANFVKMLRSVMHKTACCVGCNTCAADCHNNYISTANGMIKISDDCVHCAQCHKVNSGCWVFKSIQIPIGGTTMSNKKSLNCYSHHAPKIDWLNQFFMYKESFDQNHRLGSQMYNFFKRFLRDAGLLDKSGYTDFARVVEKLGLECDEAWALMLVNLSYTTQINWIVKTIPFNEEQSKDYTQELLIHSGADEKWVHDVWTSFTRFADLPFNNVGLVSSVVERNKVKAIIRHPWSTPEPRVVLYALYKFAECCGDYKQFTLTRLMDHDIESDGVIPVDIFGTSRDVLEKIINGLSVNYPDFITTQFTLDLENITLNKDHTSKDVLDLFGGE